MPFLGPDPRAGARGYGGKTVFGVYIALMLLAGSVCTGCVIVVDRVATQHRQVMDQIALGDSIASVREKLGPLNARLPGSAQKLPERFVKDGKRVFILYARSSLQHDGLTTDDEFTPYVFEDGILVAIGWSTLGGPKTQGQAVPETTIHIHETIRH